MNNDKPRYRCRDYETGEKIYFDNIDAGVLAWLYLHYVTMDNCVLLDRWFAPMQDYLIVTSNEEEHKLFDNLLHAMYEMGIKTI